MVLRGVFLLWKHLKSFPLLWSHPFSYMWKTGLPTVVQPYPRGHDFNKHKCQKASMQIWHALVESFLKRRF
jgi:hypothetical protein